MPPIQTELIKKCAQRIPKDESHLIPPATRGIYALLEYKPRTNRFDVVYIGMTARSSVGKRIARHKNTKKGWSHFSIFQVRDSVGEERLKELEGLFREVYSKDSKANRLNIRNSYKKFDCENDLSKW